MSGAWSRSSGVKRRDGRHGHLARVHLVEHRAPTRLQLSVRGVDAARDGASRVVTRGALPRDDGCDVVLVAGGRLGARGQLAVTRACFGQGHRSASAGASSAVGRPGILRMTRRRERSWSHRGTPQCCGLLQPNTARANQPQRILHHPSLSFLLAFLSPGTPHVNGLNVRRPSATAGHGTVT